MKKIILLFVMIVLLVACGKPEGERSSVTPPVVPTKTSGPTKTPLPTDTPAPTAPIQSTAVSTTTPSPAPTEPLPTATPSPTPFLGKPATSIELSLLVNGLDTPLYLTHAGDERLFVVEQPGTIRIIENGVLLDAPFLDMKGAVATWALEQGLLSVAFHPNYGGNGRFFVNYSHPNGDTIVARYQASDDPNIADHTSGEIILSIHQPYGNHNGGQLKFGPDGYLYIGMGDGGSANDPDGNGQNLDSLLGTLLRIDVDYEEAAYAIPADNPFIGDDNARNEIWAYGLRNPWRFSFDLLTGDLYIADVGQNLWEEVHFTSADSVGGENYGWKIMEGTHCFESEECDQTGLEIPIFEYHHDEGCSITGGYVYRGQQFPEMEGNYFVGDFCQGTVWTVFGENGRFTSNRVYDSQLTISSFGEGADGELYLLDHVGGSVYHIISGD